MKNKELADLFAKMADILEFRNENPFKISAYRKASRVLGDLTQDIQEIAETGLDQLWMISLGVGVARRGWLETPDLLNTLPLKGILKWCHAGGPRSSVRW